MPPAIEIESENAWTINGIPRGKADPDLCQIIISDAHACAGCPLNVPQKAPSDFLNYVLELDEIVAAGARLELSFFEWKTIALLKRKRNEAEIRRMKERK